MGGIPLVVFNLSDHPNGSYIYNIHSGERMELQHQDVVLVLDTKIAPSNMQADPFARPGQ